MIATIENTSLLDETDGLAQMFVHSEPYAHYADSRAKMEQDETAQALIRHFIRIREKYDEVQRFGRYHPDYKTVIRQMMEAKRAVDLNPLVSEYRRAEKKMEDLLGQVSLLLARAVSDSIKVPTGDPFFDRSCGTGCGSGGKCGCRI
ncbi:MULTISPECIES: YlbF family regulator [unclassified Sporolactobacillus]|uniref:YlbF family regulator n=1 Tax=unclassified Sporolactobacillus TaxID=2628533 RepID=UPI002368E761|nr:YlbF family regulator [Sporolactobacillus sp. CQH2019]MDD9147175.1 YlbF family regulator [Sporolactobacillus sp. CQH2019]